MFHLIRATLVLLLVSAPGALAEQLPAAKDPLMLGTVDAEVNGDASYVNIRFNRKPDFESVSVAFHGSFLQVDLPGTIVPSPGAFVEGAGSYVKKIGLLQRTSSDGAVRIFLSTDAAKVQKAMHAEILGSRILLTIDHKTVEETQIAATPVKPAEKAEAPPTAEASTDTPTPAAATTAVAASKPVEKPVTPADVVKGNALPEAISLAGGGIDFREKLMKIAAFIGGLLFLATLMMMLRPLIRRHKKRKKGSSQPSEELAFGMSQIASMALAPKQKLSVIQVGDEKILLAIGPESVTYITTLGKKQNTAMAMAAAFPQALPQQAVAMSQIPQMSLQQPAHQPPAAPEPKPQAKFEQSLKKADSHAAHIKLKDDETTPPKKAATPKPTKRRAGAIPANKSGGRLNIAVGDDGIKDYSRRPAKQEDQQADPRTIEDVTQLIRQKLQAFKSL